MDNIYIARSRRLALGALRRACNAHNDYLIAVSDDPDNAPHAWYTARAAADTVRIDYRQLWVEVLFRDKGVKVSAPLTDSGGIVIDGIVIRGFCHRMREFYDIDPAEIFPELPGLGESVLTLYLNALLGVIER